MIKELVMKNRSYRRFDENYRITGQELRELTLLARFVPSAGNQQPMRYCLIAEPDEQVFACLGWAASLPDWPGPEKGERPSAYIVILSDKMYRGSHEKDVGIAAQTILLGAVEKGLGGCMLGSVNRTKLADYLGLDNDSFGIELVLAIGKPVEEVRIVDVGRDGSIRYYRDADRVHYVPKRSADELILSEV